MVDYSVYMGVLRNKHIPQKTISVQLPPIKEDCTCVVQYSLSMINSPVDYCAECDNKGYIETPVLHDITGSVMDAASDTNPYPNVLVISGGGDDSKQQYSIHANLSDCIVSDHDYQNCFDLSKMVTIENINYRINSIDKSTLLGQIRVIVSKTT